MYLCMVAFMYVRMLCMYSCMYVRMYVLNYADMLSTAGLERSSVVQ